MGGALAFDINAVVRPAMGQVLRKARSVQQGFSAEQAEISDGAEGQLFVRYSVDRWMTTCAKD